MTTTKAQQRAVTKYMKENYDVYQIRMPKGKKAALQEYAKNHSESLNAFINRAIDEAIAKDGNKVNMNQQESVEEAKTDEHEGETIKYLRQLKAERETKQKAINEKISESNNWHEDFEEAINQDNKQQQAVNKEKKHTPRKWTEGQEKWSSERIVAETQKWIKQQNFKE